jgi:diguanylate cyclase (GGDEF)-like protein
LEHGCHEEPLRGLLASSFDNVADRVRSSLNRIVSHCAEEFDSQISLVSLIKPTKQSILASVGAEIGDTPLDISFCVHAVRSQKPLIVGNAHNDPRFRENQFVVGEPFVRSYMGYPIRHSRGAYVGALCIIDNRPERFAPENLARLETYARVVEDILELHTIHLEGRELTKEVHDQYHRLLTSNRILRQAEAVAKMGAWEVEIGSEQMKWSEGTQAIFESLRTGGGSLKASMKQYEPADRLKIEALCEEAIDSGTPFDFETDLFLPEGKQKRVRVAAERVEADGTQPARLVGVVQDVTETFQSRMALHHAAEHDSLTGLYNRFAFDRELQQRLSDARGTGEEVAVLLIDLDGFKDVNDVVGHIVGDIILQEVSERIARATPEGGFAARWGGDEFAVVLPPRTGSHDAQAVGMRLLDQLVYHSEVSGHLIELGATAGLAIGTSGTSVKELVRRADTALYHGKKRDQGKLHVYEAGLEQANVARQYALNEVRTAIRETRIFPAYQPVIELRTGRLVGYEALMRLNSRMGRRITATEVLPALIDPILSREISTCMIDRVSKEFSSLKRSAPTLDFVSINASEADLLASGFATQLLAQMREQRVELSRITLEVTETMLLVDNTQAVRRVLTELRDNGVRIALDDFGTGYSSLSHLRDFPIDKVKIDGSFIQAMANDQQAAKIVRALIGMANSMGLSVIAEGVETATQSRLLQQMGCELGQGFLFGHAEELGKLTVGRSRNYEPQPVYSAA